MKYRLVELLQCPFCKDDLRLSNVETQSASRMPQAIFSCQRYCALEETETVPAQSRCIECHGIEIKAGLLGCTGCRRKFPILDSVPWLTGEVGHVDQRVVGKTVEVYSHLWQRPSNNPIKGTAHVEAVEQAVEEPVVQGRLGIDAGSGAGFDTMVMANRHPDVELISLDMSEGVYATKRLTESLPNVHVIRGSVLSIPIRSNVCDFGYSFGVLHHTIDPPQGLREIARVMKAGAKITVYLYEDHADNPWKAIPLKVVTSLRRITTTLNTRVLSGLCYALSPVVVLFFSVPARIMRWFKSTKALADRTPFNFGTSPFSVHADLLDRFGAPIEERYSREGIVRLFREGGLAEIRTTKLKTAAGWVARGLKPVA